MQQHGTTMKTKSLFHVTVKCNLV